MARRKILGVVVAGRDHTTEYRRRVEKDPEYFRRMARIRWHDHGGGGRDRSFVGGMVPMNLAEELEAETRRRGVTKVAILTEALKKELFKK